MPLLVLLLGSQITFAAIFGNDDRVDTRFASTLAQELGSSVPALIQHQHLKKLEGGKVLLTGKSMHEFGLCPSSSFADEKIIANCSASFIGQDLVLTAAHCFDQKRYACETYSVVFDYQRNFLLAWDYIIDESAVYRCKKIVYSKFDPSVEGEDLAIIQLDRVVTGRVPVKINTQTKLKRGDSLLMLGYPMGISQKAVEVGEVLKVDKKNVSFKNNLDSFSVNSGGPIFNTTGEQVGVLVRGTGANFFENQGCFDWMIAGKNDFSDANDLSPLKKVLKKRE